MQCLTMPPAKVLLLSAVLALGCRRSVPATSPPADAKPVARYAVNATAPVGPSAMVKIAAFDCEKYDVLPNETPPKGLVAPGAGVRAWKGGGPYGSAWNVEDLRCAARATASCANGKVLFTLRAGQHVLAEKESPLVNGAADFEVVTPAAAWERGYDKPAKTMVALKLPFKTATLRVQAALDCGAPAKASLRDWNYRFVVADDVFVAGFASGE
jgi:hypothetical protein